MCTVTWLRDAAGFHLLHNRDELRTRQLALGPRIHERDGVRFIAPVDANAGGTWVGVNEFGLAACLLNRYEPALATAPTAGFTSRGLLLMSVLTAHSIQAIQNHIIDMRLDIYQPFQLVIAQLDAGPTVMDWTGSALRIDTQPDARLPLVSSSLDGVGVNRVRGRIYQPLRGHATLIGLRAFHASHDNGTRAGGPSAYSVCMHRADAQTVSFTEINITSGEVELHYQPGPPCQKCTMLSERLALYL